MYDVRGSQEYGSLERYIHIADEDKDPRNIYMCREGISQLASHRHLVVVSKTVSSTWPIHT